MSGIRSYFTVARVSRDIFRQSSVGALYTDWECPTTGEYNRIGGVDTRLKFNPNWTLDGQAVTSSSNILGNFFSQPTRQITAKPTTYPFSSGNQRQRQLLRRTGRTARVAPRRTALHLRRNYNDISPGFVSIPGFINRVDIRETQAGSRLPLPPQAKAGSSTGARRSITRHDFDHTGLRLDTDYSRILRFRGADRRSFICVPMKNCASACGRRISASMATALSPPLPNQDYHEHTSGASFQTGYFKKATILASYYWGDAVNFVAHRRRRPATLQPSLRRARRLSHKPR